MELYNLKPAEGSVKNEKKRIGRGQGSGKGGTATKGHKGQKARSGYSKKVGFEGGQMPLQRRVPKFGFKNINRVEYKALNISDIQKLAEEHKLASIDMDTLVSVGLVSNKDKVKILGDGELTLALEVKAHAFSKSAEEKIKAQKGNIIVL